MSDAESDSARAELLSWFFRGESPEGPGRTIPGLAYNAGMVSAARGDSAGVREAIRAVDRLEKTEHANRLPQMRAGLEAEIAWIGGRSDRVIGLLSNSIDPNNNQRYRLARALEEVGRVEEALLWYQSYPDLDLNAPNQLGWRAASLLRMAALHERRGDAGAAARDREEFRLLLQDADPEVIARVEAGAATRVPSPRQSRQDGT